MAKKTAKAATPKVATPGQLPTGKLALIKDPRVYAARLPLILPERKRICGLDISTSTGVAFVDIIPGRADENTIYGGQWDLSLGKFDTGPLRFIRLKAFLTALQPDLIMYEEVKNVGKNAPMGMKRMTLTALVARAVSGAQVVQGLCATLITWAEERGIPCQGVPIATLKRWGTGKGNASKEDMIAACNEQFGTDFDPKDDVTGVDNIADAMLVCAMGAELYSDGLIDEVREPEASSGVANKARKAAAPK